MKSLIGEGQERSRLPRMPIVWAWLMKMATVETHRLYEEGWRRTSRTKTTRRMTPPTLSPRTSATAAASPSVQATHWSGSVIDSRRSAPSAPMKAVQESGGMPLQETPRSRQCCVATKYNAFRSSSRLEG